ncbi:MAG TPA: glycosyltransferase family 39 protein [Thermoanaerobaculia bacterium]|nr:glycosyltransferase family 39 protein [Thermoanaerobaculia bacterium]
MSIAPARRISWAALAGFGAVVLARALTLPRSLWEMDEVLFARAIEHFDPLSHRPHPPGYPLLVGLGKLFNLVFHDPFTSLAALSFISSLVGYAALVAAFRRILGPGSDRVAVAGALLFHLSPVMLVQAPLPMSDPPALMFLSLALWAAALLSQEGSGLAAVGLGASASAAIGCRPQLALAVLPMLAVALWQAPSWRRRGEAAAAFTLVSLLWFIPLLAATGGPRGFLDYELKQVSYVAEHDARKSRHGCSPYRVAKRFISHPWGRRTLAMPVLLLAITGAGSLAWLRKRAALPLAVLSAVQLAVCLKVMDPADAVRYALPWVLGVAFAAAAGCDALAHLVRRPAVAWLPVALILGFSAFTAAPVLTVRSTTLSPPVQAAEWIKRNLPPKAILLVEEDMAPHASYLLGKFDLAPVEEGLRRAARRPKAAVYLLAEGESHWQGAVAFRWPKSDAYRRLTRNHYRVVSLSPIPADYRYQIVRGVYGWEPTVRDARWRWLDADAAIRIFPRGTRALAVTLGLDLSAPLPSNSVAVSVNGAPAATLEIARGSRRRLELPRPAAAGPVDISFRSARSFVPAASGPKADTRRLAVQLLAVERIAG